MKISLLSFIFLLVSSLLAGQEGKKIVILHTNDLHSHLNGFSPEAAYTPLVTGNDSTTGGFSRIADIFKSEREKNSDGTLIVDAGDFLMGTLFQSVEPREGFQLRLMKKMGYDIVSLGNHEFDFGPGKLCEIINHSRERGEIPLLMLGNVIFDESDPADDQFEELYKNGTIVRKTEIVKSGIKIGLFSLLGKDASEVAPLARPLKFSDQVAFAREMVKSLRNDSCDLVICLSHSGVTRNRDGSWGGEDVRLAEKVRGLDLIVSGHTHTKLDKPVYANGVPIVQTGEYGKYVGRMELSRTGAKWIVDDYKLIPVTDNIKGDPAVDSLVRNQEKLVTSEILAPLGLHYSDRSAESSFLLECDENGNFMSSNLGPMVADAIRYYVNNETTKGSDVCMVAVGIIRDRIVPGIISPADIFRVMPLGSGNDDVPGYPLSRLYVTGRELKSILEILQVAYKSAPSNYCFYSGLRVEYKPDGKLLNKIRKIELTGRDGVIRNVDMSRRNKQLYSVTANSYMLKFIGIIRKKSFGLINVVPKDVSGKPVRNMDTAVIDFNEKEPGIQEGKEWQALIKYISSMKDRNNDGIPDIDIKYSEPVRSFFEIKR